MPPSTPAYVGRVRRSRNPPNGSPDLRHAAAARIKHNTAQCATLIAPYAGCERNGTQDGVHIMLATSGAHMRKVITSTILISLFSVTSAEASLAITSPASVCALLNNIGLATGSWKNFYDNEFGCISPYREIGPGFPLANNLAYYVEGDKNSVTGAKLVLNVNTKSQATSAHSALLRATEALTCR